MASPNPNVQRVPKMLLAVNDWIATGKVDKEQGSALSGLTLGKNDELMLLADEIGTTPDADVLTKALAIAASAPKMTSSGSYAAARKQSRPALNIGAVKEANSTQEAARADEVESQADALLKAKRERNLKRQSLPEKSGLPQSVADQLQPQQQ